MNGVDERPSTSDPWWRAAAGPLNDAARTFREWRRCDVTSPGRDAIAWLAEDLDRFAHEDTALPDDDERYVEGAGAFLGSVLVSFHDGIHVSRDHGHRVLLGAYGCFDPFAAIDQALDAEVPAESFADSLRRAEAEREGAGPYARVVRAFAQLVGPARVVSRFELSLRLDDGTEVDLTRIAESCEGQGESALNAAAAKVAALLPGADGSQTGASLGWGDAASRIVPRLASQAFVSELDARGGGSLASRELGHGVRLALQVRYATRARYVRDDEIERWCSEGHDPWTASIANLAARSASARFARLDTPTCPLIVARTGDGLDSSRLVLPTLPAVVGPELGTPFLAAAPHRDVLLLAPDSPEAHALLSDRAADQAARAPHPISPALFRIAPGSITPA